MADEEEEVTNEAVQTEQEGNKKVTSTSYIYPNLPDKGAGCNSRVKSDVIWLELTF